MQVEYPSEETPKFRLDVQLHELLTRPTDAVRLPPLGKAQVFPDPVFPEHPELLGPIPEDDGWQAPEKRH